MFRVISNKAKALNLSFSVNKTDLIHWRSSRDRCPRFLGPISLDDTTISPSKSVKWLVFWLQDNHSTHQHFTKRLALAFGAWTKVRRLSEFGKGLNPQASPHLAQILIRPTLLYGAEILSPPKETLEAMSSFWRKVGIWVTNCFHSSSYAAVHAESCLIPIQPLLNLIQAKYALRITGTHPFCNPASARLPPNPPIHWSPAPPERTPHFKNRKGIYLPRKWFSTSKKSALTYLPVDKVLSRLMPLMSLKPLMPRYYKAALPPGIDSPNIGEDDLTPNQASEFLYSILDAEWTDLYQGASYKYPILSNPHTFMRLGKFQASRIHQMHSGKSYLAAQPTHYQQDQSSLCPACESEEETFEHAALHCPAREHARQTHCPELSSISHDSPLWTSFNMVQQFSRYISHARVNFPLKK